MNAGKARLFALALLSATLPAAAAGEVSEIPYNKVNLAMKFLKSEKINGVECVPWYLKSAKPGTTLDVAKANFRVRTWDGEEIPLTVEALASIPEDKLTDFEKSVKKDDGVTHRMWLPKNMKKYMDGTLVNSLPKGSVEMGQGISISGKLPLGGKKKKEEPKDKAAPLAPTA